ncbi:type II toxin-antitoxin system VapC family toxin [Aetokthonos hydrillicola Thurmond2011]|uniref:Type II toxin-antitoxin system VapC family toxin n=1 Tax=Aetokthonos hydrillicola Thurmond2011 TaxID=2712845 RepID=A0AAP5I2F9_9CYAN|nr:type II toxin-antitoxin system VapC family toxin [Aetokthonos hydrillicola]MBO3459364.1 type II toxin-antitoxin system VapC family toxin [Aetokthonos hydrillicola CCALA 1050]MBW4586510.1 type II toxin-antitoxin system VapC family toxin [Aetokthonos hydrillicola CCALA 1050]MDR9893546.1 type II toxin-antitoxin system VapC family toxin [Aetokthonos hydrillicola Thurmond2011]
MVTAIFLDTSTLLKRYVSEIGTTWIQSLTAQEAGNLLIVARIAWVEVLSALARRQREGSLSGNQANQILQAFRYHFDTQYQKVELLPSVIQIAGQLVSRYPLRAFDAVQLASSLCISPQLSGVNAMTFFT